MAIPLSQFRSRISRHVPGCPLPFIDNVVRDACIQFCEDTLIWNIAFEMRDVLVSSINSGDNDSLVINIYDYDDTGSVSVDDEGGVTFTEGYASYDPILVSEIHFNQSPWLKIKKAEFENDITDLYTGGFKYFNFPSRYTVKIFPLDEFAEAGDNFTVFLKLAVKPTLIATVVEDSLYYDYREAVAAHALSVLHSMPGRAWTNLDQSAIELTRYASAMGLAKIRIDRGNSPYGSTIYGGFF